VARQLIKAGIPDVYALKDGWLNWIVEGYPTQKKQE